MTLVEDVQTKPLSQKQLIMENVSKKLDADTKQQVMPLLEEILQAQPTIKLKSYAQTSVQLLCQKIDINRWVDHKLDKNYRLILRLSRSRFQYLQNLSMVMSM